MWRYAGNRPMRPLDTVILDAGLKDAIIKDCQDFIASKDWYMKRGIPFRRGYLLYGAPGSGKTSFIQSLAGEFRLDIYTISLAGSDMDDSNLMRLIAQLPERCIILMEDIDAAITITGRRDETGSSNRNQSESTRHVTLSGLLNVLDGVSAQEGRILFATTNHIEALDPALTRPGRMDVHYEFKLASKSQITALFTLFFDDLGSENSAKEKIERGDLTKLAVQFSDAIPEHMFSMAELQGYLMRYKAQPYEAAAEAFQWAECELERKDAPAITITAGWIAHRRIMLWYYYVSRVLRMPL
ncbi:hypothetical protein POSPLADRAFT_1045450 [Postia placenta MAD-698-R-SB12]|uniref:AAA+ ATPase domain-containing protein n=1 Tax=Postia placenta MAD-698-R-SB12 TaxID=670580 RepID=A0A1X6N6V5_9APHY|nr:hypothetical protein POSPLADRAFT_1045450 [Postia placenta MAD-698-R-SB12]OSX64379.1 hypothetical protein POSPLADRAFT_1045450 [Postia placenta MAD-698-R-SB12]